MPRALHQQRASCQTAAPVCASIFGGAGGPLRTVGFDGEIRNEEEMREHHDRACDDLLAHCPPVDAETLVAWRDEYVSKLGDIYAQRRTLGMMLASSGSEITVSSATPQHHGGGFDDAKAIGAGERERDEGGDDDHRADQKAVAKKMDASHSARGSDGSDGTDEAAVARFAIHAPRGMLEFWVDPESPYYKEVFGEDKTFVLYCGSGWRSALTAVALKEMGFDCAHLKEGFSTWEEKGGPVERKD